MKIAFVFSGLLLLAGNAAHAQDIETDEAAPAEPAEAPSNPEIGPAEGNIFDTVHQSYQREVDAGRLDPNLETQPQQGGNEEVTTADGEVVEIGPNVEPTPDQVEQAEHPFGDPAVYENEPADEPLPEKADTPEDSSEDGGE